MNNQSLFSVIIPTYNRANDLKRCLTSLVSQTYKNFEVIVCDNASTDNTREVIEQYQQLLNLKYVRLTENSGGPAKPRNTGIQHANAEWVCFLDSDDWYLENKLEVISKLKLDEFDFIYHDLNISTDKGIVDTLRYRILDKMDAYHDLLCNSNAIGTSSTCIRKSYLIAEGGFSEAQEIVSLEDFHLWIRLAKKGIRFYYLPLALGTNYLGTDNLTQYNDRQINRFKALYGEFIAIETNKKSKRKIQAALNYCVAVANIKNKKKWKGLPLLCYAIFRASPDLRKIILRKIRLEGTK